MLNRISSRWQACVATSKHRAHSFQAKAAFRYGVKTHGVFASEERAKPLCKEPMTL